MLNIRKGLNVLYVLLSLYVVQTKSAVVYAYWLVKASWQYGSIRGLMIDANIADYSANLTRRGGGGGSKVSGMAVEILLGAVMIPIAIGLAANANQANWSTTTTAAWALIGVGAAIAFIVLIFKRATGK